MKTKWKASQWHNPLLQVFFPVVSQSHYYLICFNLKQGSSHIFDNSVVDVPFSAKYGKIPMIVDYVRDSNRVIVSNVN
ncbi:hypothetical protein OSB04_005142 [Centaurea solstitialis]|uniref:Uncharacterized protein n=1 Tax=Centaurea solstitialis TaxID=347529 RepID=A0AA38WGI0_9ASTR|nr:hypothetical protein OSB04_005142 [Centaurea solstitialis]